MLQHNSLNGKNGIYEFYSSVNNQSQIELMSKPNFYSDYCDGSKILSVNNNPITIHFMFTYPPLSDEISR